MNRFVYNKLTPRCNSNLDKLQAFIQCWSMVAWLKLDNALSTSEQIKLGI